MSPGPLARVWRDWVLVAVLVPVAVIEGALRADLPWRAVAVLITLGLVPTLLWRRTRPLLMLAIAFGVTNLATLFTAGESAETNTLGYLLILVYSLTRWGSGREVVTALPIMIGSVFLSVAAGRIVSADAFGAFAVMFAALALGAAFRFRAGARAREPDQVKLLERERLARDLHDTVAHHISAMAIRAQAGLANAASRPEAATDALRVIEAEAARALDEMRAMVHVLRHDEQPGRGIADLQQLAAGNPAAREHRDMWLLGYRGILGFVTFPLQRQGSSQ